MAALLPVDFTAPPVNPLGLGLYAAATVADTGQPTRISSGVLIRPFNCSTGHGTWETDVCLNPVDPEQKKAGVRLAPDDPFEALVTWGYDECDLTESEADIIARAEQNLRLHEQNYVEAEFATRIKADAGVATVVPNIVAAVSELEVAFGNLGLVGTLHASRRFAALAAQYNLIVRSSGSPLLRTPLGNIWAFGGGYDTPLGTTIVGTGQTFVWRDAVTSRATVDHAHNLRAAVAERTVVAGYECAAIAVTVTP